MRLVVGTLLAALILPAGASAKRSVSLDLLGRAGAGGVGAAEIAAFDPASARAFVTDARDDALDVYDLSSGAPALLPGARIDLTPYGAGPNSVAVSERCGLIAVAVEAEPKTDPGRLASSSPTAASASR